jgi:hypothetical protein
MTRRAFRVTACLIASLSVFAHVCSAQTGQSATSSSPGSIRGTSPAGDDMIQVSISASTQHIIRGSIYGLDADLKNVSTQMVSLEINTITLAVQPEMAPDSQRCVFYYAASLNPGYYNPAVNSPIILQPGEHVPIFFNLGLKPITPSDPVLAKQAVEYAKVCGSRFWSGLRKVLDFTPGSYSFVLSGKVDPYQLTFNAQGQPVGGQWSPLDNFSSQTIQLPVGIDQSQILLCAALGGLLAYFVMALRGKGDVTKLARMGENPTWDRVRQMSVIVKNAGAAAFLSAAVTIVASRLSETDFPVKVSVNDFWGALTIGFVAYFIGGKFIDKLADLREPDRTAKKADLPPEPSPGHDLAVKEPVSHPQQP